MHKQATAGNVVDHLESFIGDLEHASRGLIDVAEVEQLELRIQAVLWRLRSLKNRLAVASLSDEILSAIMRFALPYGRKTGRSPTHPAIGLASVCRRWHAVALSDPLLWSCITVSGAPHPGELESVTTCLTRAKGAPVSLGLDFSRFLESRLSLWVHLLNSHSFHIQGVSLYYKRLANPRKILEQLSLPQVETFVMKDCYRYDREDYNESWSRALPQMLGNNLRHLTLSYFTSWMPSVFTNLLTLELTSEHDPGTMTLSLFLDVLDASPLLRTLSIHSHGPIADVPETTSSRISILSSLSELKMNRCSSHTILSHLKVQPTTTISIGDPVLGVQGLGRTYEDFLVFFQTIPDDIASLGLSDNIDTFKITCSWADLEFLAESPEQELFYFFGKRGRDDPTILLKLLSSLRRHPMFLRAKRLAIEFEYDWGDSGFGIIPSQDWRLSCYNLPNLERLKLEECVTVELLIALGSMDQSSTSRTMVCPRLHSLQLCQHLSEDMEHISLLFEQLIMLVETRSESGCPIRELDVQLWRYADEEEGTDQEDREIEREVIPETWTPAFRRRGVDKVKVTAPAFGRSRSE